MGHFYYSKRYVPRVRTKTGEQLKRIIKKQRYGLQSNEQTNSDDGKPDAELSVTVTVSQDSNSPAIESIVDRHDEQQPDDGRNATDGQRSDGTNGSADSKERKGSSPDEHGLKKRSRKPKSKSEK